MDVEREKIIPIAQKILLSDEGKEAVNYLKSQSRNFTDENIKSAVDIFKIGYMPNYVLNEYGDKHEFSGRLILPLYNQYNELLAISSRDWREGASSKFFHESFQKSYYLYGLNVAKENIIRHKQAILVEGEFDVQYLHLCGFNFTVGTLSSTLQMHQIAILSRYCKELFIVFDGDNAGRKSEEKIMNMKIIESFQAYENMGFMDIIPVKLPEKTDPDQFLKRFGRDEFIKLLRNSRRSKHTEFKL